MSDILNRINGFVWGLPTISMLFAVGLYISVRTHFFQITKTGQIFSEVVKPSIKKDGKNGMTSFQSVCTALSATMGTGNLAGVAGAVALGGAGSLFWLWCSAILSASVKFCEISLSVKYRSKNNCGGPMYYIKYGLGGVFLPLSYIFASFGLIASFGSGNITQINAITSSVVSLLGGFFNIKSTDKLLISLLASFAVCILATVILLGGVERLGSFSEKAVPFMTVLYAVVTLGVITANAKKLPQVTADIFYGAFRPEAVTAGTVTSVTVTAGRGIARGVFSNEAGLGTAPIAYSKAKNGSDYKLGLLGVFEVFVDTAVCTLTALAVLCAGRVVYGTDAGISITLCALESVYGIIIRPVFCVILCFFAFTSVTGWGFYGTQFATYIFGEKAKLPFIVIFFLIGISGCVINTKTVWEIAETCNGLMILPNLISLVLLSEYPIKLINNDI